MPDQAIDDVLDDLVEVWHSDAGMTGVELPQFLGMTEDEYRVWASHPSQAADRLDSYWRWLHARVCWQAGGVDA